VVIVGPTAGGKSDVAVAVARAFGGEVISADSMQVYRHLDAGTAKPTGDQRAQVPHHLVDAIEPTEPFTVADWLAAAEALIAQMHERGVLPVVAGGTNLYIKALLEGMFAGPGSDPVLRAALAEVPGDELHAELALKDPQAAERIDPNDRKRVIRALEVHQLTGKPISQLQSQWKAEARADEPYRHHPVLIGLRWGVKQINRRINARIKQMFSPPEGREDPIDETARLLEAGLLGPQAREAIGTRQALPHLQGECDDDEVIEKVKIDTRRFAKAQRTWLKRYRGVHWIDCDPISAARRATVAVEIVSRELGRAARAD